MSHMLRVAWAIARRDYVAAVFSRLFLLFLLLPFLAAGFGGLFAAIGPRGAAPPEVPLVAVAGPDREAVAAARDRLAARLGGDALPRIVDARADGAAATLDGPLASPRLALGPGAPPALAGQMEIILDEARAPRLASEAPASLRIVHVAPRPRTDDDRSDGTDLGRAAQYTIFILTIMLAGRLLANFIEERGNKVIEVLAAAAPVDAIFLGKLAGMLLFSLTCVAVWGGAALIAMLTTAPGLLRAFAPAMGWGTFAPLALLYFASNYLLFGTVLLGLGAHARTPADVQTLALPTTIAQLLLFGFAAMDVARPDGRMAIAAALLPWSSPLAMVARAAERPALTPHLAALAWQGLWLFLSVRFAARRFRRAVLGSGAER